MFNYVKAELLKLKRTSTMKIVVGIPFVAMVLAVVAGEYYMLDIALNWWYILFFPTILVLITGNIFGQNDKKNEYKGLLLSVEDTEKLGLAKLVTVAICSLISTVIFTILVLILILVYSKFFDFEIRTGILNIILGNLIINISYLFLVPMVGLLVKKFSYLLVTVGGIIIFNILDGLMWKTEVALYNPFSITSMLMSTIFKIQPNGVLNNGEIPLLSISQMGLSIGINISVFLIFSFLLIKLWNRRKLVK
ncbi:MAG: ABC transporter permease [Miniphocaeibacter sp.]|uniref:ABC transporter permease n=1 Tax=Miniphocaeibacter sp. TaxID=3100973 RepID=UPI0018556900|nr:ABC transporter permease subunit [Gallicola sp.]